MSKQSITTLVDILLERKNINNKYKEVTKRAISLKEALLKLERRENNCKERIVKYAKEVYRECIGEYNKEESVCHLRSIYICDKMLFMEQVLFKIAIDIDSIYPDHISNTTDGYIISLHSSPFIIMHHKDNAKLFRIFPIFRGEACAEFACEVMKVIESIILSNEEEY